MYEVETGLDMDATIVGNSKESDFLKKEQRKGQAVPYESRVHLQGGDHPLLS